LLAEARFQLQRHQQFIPFALERVTFAHFIGIEAAGQLLGEGAAALQHLAASNVDEQGTGGADGIHPWMPPETGVFAGEQCGPQRWRELSNRSLLAVVRIETAVDRCTAAVVEHQRPAHWSQTAAHRHAEGAEAKQQ